MRKASIIEALEAALRTSERAALCIAYSGGPDSTALLHALAQLPEARERGLRALHVDHGLHPDSADWAKRCAVSCGSLGVPLTTVRVEVNDTRGEGIEAAARRARRRAFAENLGDGEWLALAHHRDDQIETVLLKLLRGAGPEGLGGMRALRPFARGMLWRPLLDLPRASLREYLAHHGIRSIDDPANTDPHFSRNVLRNDILPRIVQHWPHAGEAILHAAGLCRAAADYLTRESDATLALLWLADGTLDAAGWRALPDAVRAPVLERWLRARGLPAPTDAQRRELERQIDEAADDRVPRVAWRGGEVRVWDGRLHAMPPLPPAPCDWQIIWGGSPLALPEGCGTLVVEGLDGAHDSTGRFDPPMLVRFRRGGERIKPVGDAHTRELRALFQHARVPPWVRARCPLIYQHDELIAIADLWTSARGGAIFGAQGKRLRWLRPAMAERTTIP